MSSQRILVVEDDPEIRYLLSVVLAGDGREIACAGNGAEARELLERDSVDLVILDLILPDVDGRSLLAELRDRAETASVQVIVVTARTGVEARRECYALGADAFIHKPFDPAVLSTEVTMRLGRASRAHKGALRDSLTGLANKAGLNAECSKIEGGYLVAVVEVDGFGTHAERWGSHESEKVLGLVGDKMRAAVGGRATLARIGGGEFVLLCPGDDPKSMSAVTSDALEAIAGVTYPDAGLSKGTLAATAGVVAEAGDVPLDDALDAARRRMAQSRQGGESEIVARDVSSPQEVGHVIVAEDDAISASILVHKLRKEGLDVVRFDNGKDAYDAALVQKPGLMILDVKMPGMDGFEVLDRLRGDARFDAVPIVMLTSMGQEADVVRGFGLGADDYILKPFSPAELAARVRRLIKRGRSAQAV